MLSIAEIDQKTDHIPSTVYQNEMKLWSDHRYEHAKYILDVGTGWGKSASCLGLIYPESSIQTIDWGDEYINHTRTKNQYITQVRQYIKQAGCTNVYFTMQRWQDYTAKYNIDVLNIDVPANYAPYKGAMFKFIPKVVSGGLIFVHSYIHPKESEPRRAVHEFVEQGVIKMVEVAKNQPMAGGGILAPAVFIKT